MTLGILAAQAACAAPPPAVVPAWPPLTVVDTTGASTTLPADLARSKLTVLVFYSEHCPCFHVHEPRLVELAKTYEPRGVLVIFLTVATIWNVTSAFSATAVECHFTWYLQSSSSPSEPGCVGP